MNFLEESVVLCKLAYSSFGEIQKQMELLSFSNIEMHETHSDLECVFAKKDNDIFLIFRGTSEFKDVKADLKFSKKDFEGFKAHKGFVKTFDEIKDTVFEYVTKNFANSDYLGNGRVYIMGHSLGGALAQLCAVFLSIKTPGLVPLIVLTTFGSPRVFGFSPNLKVLFNSIENYRVVNADDLVPKLPPAITNYFHYGNEIKLSIKDDKDGIKEHSLKKYLESVSQLNSWLWCIYTTFSFLC